MKNCCYFICCLFIFQFSFSQIEFQDISIVNASGIPNGATAVFAADLDGDGDVDMISVSRLDFKIAWYENLDGQGNFGPQIVIDSSVPTPDYLYSADIDNDGDMDIIYASTNSDTIAWYENLNGLGVFGNRQIITEVANGVSSFHIADINGDNYKDIIAADNIGIIGFVNLDGLGTFSSRIELEDTPFTVDTRVFASDIDGDGDNDIVVSSRFNDKVYWLENLDGLGSFSFQHGIECCLNGADAVFSSDLDGDGDMDVIASSFFDDKIVWYENLNGLGAFSGAIIIARNTIDGVISIFTSDLDGDGDLDVISASKNDDKIAWYENTDGLGNFVSNSQNLISIEAHSPRSVYAADADNDGDIDVFSASYSDSKVAWYKNTTGNGNFIVHQSYEPEVHNPESICFKDLDNDGDLDLLVASSKDDKVSWYENINELGDFGPQQIITLNADFAVSVNGADLDGDGDIDVFSASYLDDKIAWYENMNGLGDFGSQQIISIDADGAESIFAADIDGDGDMDLLSASSKDDKIAWYENMNGLGDFGPQQIISNSVYKAKDVHAKDLDNDGDIDILSASYEDDKISWYENLNGLGDFGPEQVITAIADGAECVIAEDIDNDGDLDVISVSSIDKKVAWYENIDGVGTFGQQQIISDNAPSARAVYVIDLDNDNDLDIISGGPYLGNKVSWFENIDGQGNFSVEQPVSEEILSYNNVKSIFAADIDGDGDIDVFSASSTNYDITFHKNVFNLNNEIIGNILYDLNLNDCDIGAYGLSNFLVISDNGFDSFATFSQENGDYLLNVNLGDFSTTLSENIPDYITASPNLYETSYLDFGNSDTANFCIQVNNVINDLNISLYPINYGPRPGFTKKYTLVYKNNGTTQLSGEITLEYESDKMEFLNASDVLVSQSANTLTFSFEELNPFEFGDIDLNFHVSPTVALGDVLVVVVNINPVSQDAVPYDNEYTLTETVIGSYDPNDITVLEGEQILIEDADKYLHYLIRFQNTGTASAINVNVENVLDNKLDWTTMQLESFSHSGRVEIKDGTDVSFIFDNINLPDSTNDEPNSHGFIAYKIKPKSDVVVGDVIYNTADIFFDFNPAIVTNTVSTEIVSSLSVEEFNTSLFSIYPNPTNRILNIRGNIPLASLKMFDINGRLLSTINLTGEDFEYQLDISNLSGGIYFLEVTSGNSKKVLKVIKK